MTTLQNAIRILSLLNAERTVLRVGEVSRETGIAKATVSRVLASLAQGGLLARDAEQKFYVAGPMGVTLGELYLRRNSLFESLSRLSLRLAEEFGFVSYVCKLEKGKLFILARNHGSYPLRLLRDVGSSVPPFETSSGRAIMARLSRTSAVRLLQQDPVWRDRTAEALENLSAIHDDGFAVASSSGTPGVAAIATAVGDGSSDELLAISLSYPLAGADAGLHASMAKRLVEKVSELGVRFGDPVWKQSQRQRSAALQASVEEATAGLPHGEV